MPFTHMPLTHMPFTHMPFTHMPDLHFQRERMLQQMQRELKGYLGIDASDKLRQLHDTCLEKREELTEVVTRVKVHAGESQFRIVS